MENQVSDFVHDPNPTVAVINQPEGSVTVTTENSDFAHRTAEQTAEEMNLKAEQAAEVAKLQESHAEENAKVPEGEPLEEVEPPVPYRASTPESDKAATDQLLEEGKITEDEHKERVADIAKIAKDETLTPQEPEPEPQAKAKTEPEKKEADTHKDAKK
jgi:hypothetical protein